MPDQEETVDPTERLQQLLGKTEDFVDQTMATLEQTEAAYYPAVAQSTPNAPVVVARVNSTASN